MWAEKRGKLLNYCSETMGEMCTLLCAEMCQVSLSNISLKACHSNVNQSCLIRTEEVLTQNFLRDKQSEYIRCIQFEAAAC